MYFLCVRGLWACLSAFLHRELPSGKRNTRSIRTRAFTVCPSPFTMCDTGQRLLFPHQEQPGKRARVSPAPCSLREDKVIAISRRRVSRVQGPPAAELMPVATSLAHRPWVTPAYKRGMPEQKELAHGVPRCSDTLRKHTSVLVKEITEHTWKDLSTFAPLEYY